MDEQEKTDSGHELSLSAVHAHIVSVQGRRTDIDMATLQPESGLEVVKCVLTPMGSFAVTDGFSNQIEVVKGDLVMLIATAILTRNGQPYDTIKIVLDSMGRMGWLWRHECEPI